MHAYATEESVMVELGIFWAQASISATSGE